MENSSQSQQDVRMQAFTLRLWQEPINGGRWEWRGRVQNVVSGEVRYFREWRALVELLLTMLSEHENEYYG